MAADTAFPHGATYLPHPFSAPAERLFGIGDYNTLREELRALPAGSYERAGVDRALAIAIDLATLDTAPGASVLDVGCSTSLISGLLRASGYNVTGIDILAEPRAEPGLTILKTDLRSFLDSSAQTFDAAILLSVLHWFPSPDGGMPEETREICRRVRRVLYVETPLADEADEFANLPCAAMFPQMFVDAGYASGLACIASTIATNAKPRRLYRVTLR